jgi:queuine/archaeosine tRNA-ribosyltransferase
VHLATAVRFTENISGDYLMIDGKKFLVCDPTYIGADIGMAMDDCKHVQAIVVKI